MKTINEYMNLPYRIELTPDHEEGGFAVSFPDLPGCLTVGETIEEASAAILAKLLIRLPEKEKTGEEAEGKTEENAGENAMGKSDTMVFSIL